MGTTNNPDDAGNDNSGNSNGGAEGANPASVEPGQGQGPADLNPPGQPTENPDSGTP